MTRRSRAPSDARAANGCPGSTPGRSRASGRRRCTGRSQASTATTTAQARRSGHAAMRSAAPPRVCIVRQLDNYELPIRREAEALAASGLAVEVILMRGPDSAPREVVNGVEVTTVPTSLRKATKLHYAFDYARFFVVVAATLAWRHVRRPYAVVQVNTMPDALVFAAVVPKLLGARVVAYMHEPTPELAETVFGAGRMS